MKCQTKFLKYQIKFPKCQMRFSKGQIRCWKCQIKFLKNQMKCTKYQTKMTKFKTAIFEYFSRRKKGLVFWYRHYLILESLLIFNIATINKFSELELNISTEQSNNGRNFIFKKIAYQTKMMKVRIPNEMIGHARIRRVTFLAFWSE